LFKAAMVKGHTTLSEHAIGDLCGKQEVINTPSQQ
jgi:hypothetical protein